MVASLALAAAAYRAGLALRRGRRRGLRREPSLRRRHLRLAKPAVALIWLGFLAGPTSAALLRGWDPFESFHAWLGLLAALLFAAAATLGHRLEHGRSRAHDTHALLGALALLAAATAAIAGFALLP